MTKPITHASLFSGIGGPEVAADMLGWKNLFHCEINPFGKAVLDYWYPDSESYEDITKTNFRQWRGLVSVLTGGFPCQPFSYAGKRKGREDNRYLWPEMLRVIDEIRPTWVVGENVAGISTMVEGGYVLKWEAKPLFSERVTMFTDTNSSNPSPLNGSAETLNAWDIPSSRCLFLLRLWEHPTEETASSSLPMMLTPTAVMTCEEPENMRARAAKNGYKNGTKFGSLESQVMYDQHFKGLLKTPSAMDAASENMVSKGVSGTSGTLAQEIMSGYVEKRGFFLPTPTCNDSINQSLPKSQERRNDSIVKSILAGEMGVSVPKEDGQPFRLSPLFTEEMMGFPLMWTTLPFLKQDGEPNPSKPTGTP